MTRFRLSCLICVFAAALSCRAAPDSPRAVAVTRAQFADLQWITGTWRGSGGAYQAFFEEYRAIDDSTLGMRAFSDSTLRVATDSSTIEWRNGTIQGRGGSSSYIVVELAPGSVRFMRAGATSGGHTFTRVSDDEWTATLHPGSPDGQPTVYTMRRIRR
jgi:hypothetical protein